MEDIIIDFGLFYILFSIVLFFLFRKYLISVLDPLLFVVLMLSSSLSLSIDSSIFPYVCICTLVFLLSFKLVGLTSRNENPLDVVTHLNLLKVFSILLFLVYFISSIYIFYVSGIPLLTDNPTESKIANYGEGTGWIRRILFLSAYIPIGLSLIIITSKQKKSFVLVFILYLFVAILQGSKGGFIFSISVFWYLYQQKNIWLSNSYKIRKVIKNNVKFFLVLTVLLFVFIVMKESKNEDQKPIFSIGFRLMEFGDVMLYYKWDDVRTFFSPLKPINFFEYEFNGILGMLRFADYLEPLGYQMTKVIWDTGTDSAIVGPNTVFFVRGHIFFGFLGGIIYSFLVGLLIAFLRKKIISARVTNLFLYSLVIYLFFQLPLYLKESSLVVSSLFDFVLYLSPLLIVSIILTKKFY